MTVKVGIAEIGFAVSPQVIRTVGLGSCVGVVIYDSRLKMGALAHVVLPDSSLAKGGTINAAKFADSAVEEIVTLLKQNGSTGKRLKAKLAGGAQMFQLAESQEIMKIGARNIEAVEKQLIRFHIEKVAVDVGGHFGRTIEFDPESEKLSIRTVHHGTYEI